MAGYMVEESLAAATKESTAPKDGKSELLVQATERRASKREERATGE